MVQFGVASSRDSCTLSALASKGAVIKYLMMMMHLVKHCLGNRLNEKIPSQKLSMQHWEPISPQRHHLHQALYPSL